MVGVGGGGYVMMLKGVYKGVTYWCGRGVYWRVERPKDLGGVWIRDVYLC